MVSASSTPSGDFWTAGKLPGACSSSCDRLRTMTIGSPEAGSGYLITRTEPALTHARGTDSSDRRSLFTASACRTSTSAWRKSNCASSKARSTLIITNRWRAGRRGPPPLSSHKNLGHICRMTAWLTLIAGVAGAVISLAGQQLGSWGANRTSAGELLLEQCAQLIALSEDFRTRAWEETVLGQRDRVDTWDIASHRLALAGADSLQGPEGFGGS